MSDSSLFPATPGAATADDRPSLDSIAAGPGGDDDALIRLGEPELDRHHARLLQCLKRLLAAAAPLRGSERLAAAAADLFESWIAHCDAERALMVASAWPHRERHLADHNRLTLALSDLLYRHIRADGGVRLEQMAGFFVGYLIEHLDRFDRPLAVHLRESRRSGQPT